MRLEQVVFSKAGKFVVSLDTLSVEAHSIITDERDVIQKMLEDATDRIKNYLESKHATDSRAKY